MTFSFIIGERLVRRGTRDDGAREGGGAAADFEDRVFMYVAIIYWEANTRDPQLQ